MKMKGLKYWFTIGSGAVAKRGEIIWADDDLIRIKVYHETGKSSPITYLIGKVNLIKSW